MKITDDMVKAATQAYDEACKKQLPLEMRMRFIIESVLKDITGPFVLSEEEAKWLTRSRNFYEQHGEDINTKFLLGIIDRALNTLGTPEQSDYDTAYQNGRQEAWDELRRAAIAHGGVSNTDTGETIDLDKANKYVAPAPSWKLELDEKDEKIIAECEQCWQMGRPSAPAISFGDLLMMIRKYFPKPALRVEELEMIVRTTDPRSYAFEQALWNLVELAKKNNVA